jgi:hypothetical protein
MIRVVVLAAGALIGLAGVAAAEAPIIAKDAAGQTYQLSDDGTWGIVVKSEDGRTFILGRDGNWYGEDESATLETRFVAALDKEIANPHGLEVKPEDVASYRTCVLAVFNAMPRAARRILVDGPDIQANFNRLEKEFPESANALDKSDRACKPHQE